MGRRRRKSGGGHEFGGSGEDSFVAVIVTKLTGALLIILVMTMGIMVLLPQGLASLHPLLILPAGEDVVDLPPATIGEPYRVIFASEGGNEFVDFDRSGGTIPTWMDWVKVTHEDAKLTPAIPGYETRVGLKGLPEGPPAEHEFELVARSTNVPKGKDEKPTDPKIMTSPPKRFRIRVIPPTVVRIDDVQGLSILSPERLPSARLGPDGKATVQLSIQGGTPPFRWEIGPDPSHPVEIFGDGRVRVDLKGPDLVRFTASVTSGSADLLRKHHKDATASRSFLWSVLPPEGPLQVLTPTELPTVEAGRPPSRLALAARGGTGSYSWSLLPSEAGRAVPPFVQVEGSELVVAPPAGEGESFHEFRLQVDDGQPGGKPDIRPVRLRVEPPALIRAGAGDDASMVKILTRETLPAATASLPYGLMLAAQGGRPPYHWSWEGLVKEDTKAPLTEKSLGLTLNEDGWIGGVPLLAGRVRFTASVRDSRPNPSAGAQRLSFSLFIDRSPDRSVVADLKIVTPPQLPDAVAGTNYQLAMGATGGIPPYRWSIQGAPPRSFEFPNPADGLLVGHPGATSSGRYQFDIAVSDQRASSRPAKLNATLAVLPAHLPLEFLTGSLPDAAINQPYEASIPVRGGRPPFRWTIAGGGLPEGLQLDEKTGLIRGKAIRLTDERAAFTIRVNQADGASKEGALAMRVAAQIPPIPLTILTDEMLPVASVKGKDYQIQLAASGGVPPYAWEEGTPWPDLTAGGLKLSKEGKLTSRVPFTAPKILTLNAIVKDSSGKRASRPFRLTVQRESPLPVSAPKLAIVSRSPFPSAIAGLEYRCALSAEGGIPPFKWTLGGDELPEGLRLVDGQIVGVPQSPTLAPVSLKLSVLDSQLPADEASSTITLAVLSKPAPPAPLSAPGPANQARAGWDRRWKYLSLALVLVVPVGYFRIKASTIDLPVNQETEELLMRGLEIHRGPNGTEIGGPPEVRQRFFQLIEGMQAQTRSLKATAWTIGILYVLACLLVCVYLV